MFILGSRLGSRVTKIPGLRHIVTPKIYSRIQEKVHRYGDKVLFIARFLPGLRAPIFVTAGISHRVSIWKFLLLDGAAAFISVPIWVYLGFICVDDLDNVLLWAKKSEVFIIAIVTLLLVLFVVYKWLKKNI